MSDVEIHAPNKNRAIAICSNASSSAIFNYKLRMFNPHFKGGRNQVETTERFQKNKTGMPGIPALIIPNSTRQ